MESRPAASERQIGGMVARWFTPAEIAGRHGRTPRDWLADLGLFGVALAFWLQELGQYPTTGIERQEWELVADPYIGLAACVAVWARRRFPLALVLAMLPALWMSDTGFGAVLVSIFSLAIHRRPRTAFLATVPYVLMGASFGYAYPAYELNRVATALLMTLLFLTPLAWGLVIRGRRQLVVGLHREAERERREHVLRLADARRAERARIAREMHDVLAHRISLLSVHAGALAYRTTQAETGTGPTLDPAEVGAAVGVIRDNADRALGELGEVLSVLRSTDPDHDLDDPTSAPQPRLGHVRRLVEEAAEGGQQVDFQPGEVLAAAESIRPQSQRTAYRVVQEGLTNARKHAPGAPVTVVFDGRPGGTLEVTLTNPSPGSDGGASTGPDGRSGSGVGLAGLTERVELDGGTLEHRVMDGRFELRARLPWSDGGRGGTDGPG